MRGMQTHVSGRLRSGHALPTTAVRLRGVHNGGANVQVLRLLRLRDALQLEDVLMLARLFLVLFLLS